MEKKYYIQNTDAGYLGNAPIFWALDRRGYTAYLERAHKFTYDEAKSICINNPNKNKAWECDYIDTKAFSVVDCQHIESKEIISFT